MSDSQSSPRLEPFATFAQVAKELNIPLFKIRRAAQRGLFPTYSILNGRKLVRRSEVVAAIEQSQSGGTDE
jgi:hypothetical protein